MDVVDSGGRPGDIKGQLLDEFGTLVSNSYCLGGGDASSQSMTTELDRKVQLAARLMQRNCNCASGKCDKLRVRKVGEGKYNIAGKNVFIRVRKLLRFRFNVFRSH